MPGCDPGSEITHLNQIYKLPVESVIGGETDRIVDKKSKSSDQLTDNSSTPTGYDTDFKLCQGKALSMLIMRTHTRNQSQRNCWLVFF